MGFGLRPGAKAPDEPPSPTGYAPPLDSTRTPDEGEQEYVTWEPGRHGQNIYYLHGALHVFDGGTEVQKYTWSNTGVRLIDQIRAALDNGLYPIFVAEGESAHKFERIRHSDFLSKAYRSFQEIGNALFVFGHSMAPNDEHIIRLLGRGRISQLFVGLYGDLDGDQNEFIRRTGERLRGMRPARRPLVSCIRSCFAVAGACDTAARAPFACRYGPIRHGVTLGLLRTDLRFGTLAVEYYDAASAHVWG